MHTEPDFVMRAMQFGAAGYIVKDAPASELAAAIHAVAGGECCLSPAISRSVIAGWLKRPAEGRAMKEIAHMLGISVKTVESHRAQLMSRIKIHDIPGLVRYAMRTGLTPPERLESF
jgi:DNA-binding NarL/FixJ family response regulator